MKRFRPALRRVLAVAAAAAIGLIGAVAIGSPASAHHSEVSGVPYCDVETGEWVVTWTIDSIAPRDVESYKLILVDSLPAEHPVQGIAVTEGDEYPHSTTAPLIGEQRLPGDATWALLKVRAEWENGFKDTRKGVKDVVRFGGPCEKAPVPQVDDASSCTELTVTVTNPEDGVTRTFAVAPSEGDPVEVELEPGQSETVTFPASEGLTYAVEIKGEEIGSGAWEDPGDCTVDIPVAHLSDCDSLTVEVTNPLEEESIEATISSGDESETLTIEPGESGEVTFDADEGTVATVTIGEESLDIAWEEPEEGCDGEGGGLPVTGSSTGLVAGAAIALLLLGAGMFLVARRRRITFTS